MSRRLVVSNGTVAKVATNYKVAVGGVVKAITKACVADGGIVRQYYPYYFTGEDPRIPWDTTPLTVREQVRDPDDSIASIIFTATTGFYTYKNYPSAPAIGAFLNPPLDGTPSDDGKYLIKVVQTGGDALTGVLATWIDANTSPEWSLDQTVIGTSSATATISVATDDGGGSPQVTTQVDKVVTFSSTVTDGGDWSTIQRDLVEHTQGVDADCKITFSPDGLCVGDADTSGAFNETWAIEPFTAGDYDVTVSVVSGTAPTGDTFDTPLTLDEVRSWTLATDGVEALACALDVTISGITKRITMDSTRTEIVNELVDPENNWCDETLFKDVAWGGSKLAWLKLTVHPDGYFIGSSHDEAEILRDDWHSASPSVSDPENYEVRLYCGYGWYPRLDASDDADTHYSSGDNTNKDETAWLPLTQIREWMWGNYEDFNPPGYWKPAPPYFDNDFVEYKHFGTSYCKAWLEFRRVGGVKTRVRICLKWVIRGDEEPT